MTISLSQLTTHSATAIVDGENFSVTVPSYSGNAVLIALIHTYDSNSTDYVDEAIFNSTEDMAFFVGGYNANGTRASCALLKNPTITTANIVLNVTSTVNTVYVEVYLATGDIADTAFSMPSTDNSSSTTVETWAYDDDLLISFATANSDMTTSATQLYDTNYNSYYMAAQYEVVSGSETTIRETCSAITAADSISAFVIHDTSNGTTRIIDLVADDANNTQELYVPPNCAGVYVVAVTVRNRDGSNPVSSVTWAGAESFTKVIEEATGPTISAWELSEPSNTGQQSITFSGVDLASIDYAFVVAICEETFEGDADTGNDTTTDDIDITCKANKYGDLAVAAYTEDGTGTITFDADWDWHSYYDSDGGTSTVILYLGFEKAASDPTCTISGRSGDDATYLGWGYGGISGGNKVILIT